MQGTSKHCVEIMSLNENYSTSSLHKPLVHYPKWSSFNNNNNNNNNNDNIPHFIAPFSKDSKRCCLYHYLILKSSQSFRFTLIGHSPAKRTPHLHLDCNIPHKRQVPDTLWSTKQIERDTNMLAVAGLELTTLIV